MEIDKENKMEITESNKKKSKKDKLEKKLNKIKKEKLKEMKKKKKEKKKEKKEKKEKEKQLEKQLKNNNEKDKKEEKMDKVKEKDNVKDKVKENEKGKEKEKEKEKIKEKKEKKDKKDKKDKEKDKNINENITKKRKLETNDNDKSKKKHKKNKKNKKKDKMELLSQDNTKKYEIKSPVIKKLIDTIDTIAKLNEIKENQKTIIPNDISSSKSSDNSNDNTENHNLNENNSKIINNDTENQNSSVINSNELEENTKYQNAEKENKNPENNINIHNNRDDNNINYNNNSNNSNNINNSSSNKEKVLVRKQDVHYKHDNVAEENLKMEYEKAPSELTDKWRKSDNLKSTGLSEVMKKGPFSNEEKEILKKAVENYLELHGIDKSLVLNLVFKKQYRNDNVLDMKRHKDFWKYVSKSLPNRSLESSYRCVTRMYHPDNFNGNFTEKEDKELLRLYCIYGPSWKKIGEMIGRMGTAVKDRYNILQKKSFSGSGAWTKKENEQYEKIIYELYADNKFVEGMPVFSEVSKKLKTRSPKQCYDHWVFSKKNFIEGIKVPITLHDRINYLEKLSKLRVQDETQVDWKLVVDPNKPWKPFLYSKDFTESKKKYIKNTDDITFNECIKKILEIVRQENIITSNEYVMESDMEE